MTLRSADSVFDAMIGPRSRAVGAPQLIGKGCGPPEECEVRRIWPEVLRGMCAVLRGKSLEFHTGNQDTVMRVTQVTKSRGSRKSRRCRNALLISPSSLSSLS